MGPNSASYDTLMFFSFSRTSTLTPEQKLAYDSERDDNFRKITCFASRSKIVLSTDDTLRDRTIYLFMMHIGQYSEIANGYIQLPFLFDHLGDLARPGYPLEGYDALIHDKPTLVGDFKGTVARLQGYVAFREQRQQLVVAISGTSSLTQGYYDVCCNKKPYSEGGERVKVHAGFWKMYQGLRPMAMETLKRGIKEHGERVSEIVVTGHSMGGSLSYLLMLDIMKDMKTSDFGIPYCRKPKLRLVIFGAPRVGNEALAEFWTQCINDYRCGETDMFLEYSLITNNDGVHILPPHWMGYRHLTKSPVYLFEGNLYQIPTGQQEYGAFEVYSENALYTTDPGPGIATSTLNQIPESDTIGTEIHSFSWPLGGHNYYFRDMERLRRRWSWLGLNERGEPEEGWKDRYEAKLKIWKKKTAEKYGIILEDPILIITRPMA